MNTCNIVPTSLSLCVHSLNKRRAAARRQTRRAGGVWTPSPLTRLLGHVATRGKQHSKERQKAWRNHTIVEISDPGHSRSGHVKWPHLRKRLNARHSYTEWLITLKLSASHIRNSIYKMFISELWYGWPKFKSVLRPLHYTSVNGRKLRGASFGQKPFETLSFIGLQVDLTQWIRILRPGEWCSDGVMEMEWPSIMLPRSFQVMKGHQQFFSAINFDRQDKAISAP